VCGSYLKNGTDSSAELGLSVVYSCIHGQVNLAFLFFLSEGFILSIFAFGHLSLCFSLTLISAIIPNNIEDDYEFLDLTDTAA
jgi:hypothetical protein